MNSVNKDKIIMIRYTNIEGNERVIFKVNNQRFALDNFGDGWECHHANEDHPVLVRCKDDMIAIINSEKKMRYLLGEV